MSKIYTSADQLIGKTPLLELSHIEKAEKLEAKLLAKLEYFNPAGSVKDRSRPPATPVSALHPWPPHAAIASSSSCPRP